MNNSKLVIAIGLLLVTAGLAAASEQTNVMAPVHQFMDGFNKGDVKTALAACADQTSIIDEFAPFYWEGAGGCSAWAQAYEADTKKNGVTEGHVTLSKATHVDIAGNRAYIVLPASYRFKQRGKPVNEMGSTFTVVVTKGAAGWRITAWTWTKR